MDVVVQRFEIYHVRVATLTERALEIDLPNVIRRESPLWKDPRARILALNLENYILNSTIKRAELNVPKKVQLCVVVSPDEMNRHLHYVIVAPMTTQARPYPTRAPCQFEGKDGYILLDQIRAVDKRFLEKKMGQINEAEAKQVLSLLGEMFAE
jgi:mRNA interferase MazF